MIDIASIACGKTGRVYEHFNVRFLFSVTTATAATKINNNNNNYYYIKINK